MTSPVQFCISNPLIGQLRSNLGIIGRAKYLLNKKNSSSFYITASYCWGSSGEANLKPVITVQKRAIRLISGASRCSHTSPLFRELRLLKLHDLLKYQLLLFLHHWLFGQLPQVMPLKLTLHSQVRPSRAVQHLSEMISAMQRTVMQIAFRTGQNE